MKHLSREDLQTICQDQQTLIDRMRALEQELAGECTLWKERYEMVSRAYMRLEVECENLSNMLDQSQDSYDMLMAKTATPPQPPLVNEDSADAVMTDLQRQLHAAQLREVWSALDNCPPSPSLEARCDEDE